MSQLSDGSSPGVNFINVLRSAFTLVDPESVKRYWQLDWILTLLGATGVKAVRKYVGEIEPRSLLMRVAVNNHYIRFELFKEFFENVYEYFLRW